MPRITEMWAYVIEDSGPEDEGVVAARVGGEWMPLVGADRARAESMRPFAVEIGRRLGKPIRLVRFTDREGVEVLVP